MLAAAAKVVPSQRQYEWMKLGLTAFVHFSLNTFYDREWGDGTEDPVIFNPKYCDPDSWIRILAQAGFKLAILTCKHHGGFCLWPSAFTDYSVRNSPWKNGQGDLVREFSDACRKYGIRFGVYLSPWDRHDKRYANDSAAYNQYFLNQLTELLSNYGPVHEVWFDGACVPVDGKIQQYAWDDYYALIRKLQPDAVISGIAPDVRWCGNEAGKARPAEWSVVDLNCDYYTFNRTRCGKEEIGQLGSHPVWYPAEVDTSIRPNWFYHKSDDVDVKSLHKLLNIYFNSVGHNAVLLLNVPPDCEGRIHEADIRRLGEFRKWLDQAFFRNLAEESVLSRISSEPASDGRIKEVFELNLKEEHCFNCIALAEDIQQGQLVERYQLSALQTGEWKSIAHGHTVGFKELCYLDGKITTSAIRLELTSRAAVHLRPAGIYLVPEIPPEEAAPANLYYWKCSYSVPEGQGGNLSLLKKENGSYISNPGQLPQSITARLDQEQDLQGVALLVQQDGTPDGMIRRCSCEISVDGRNWETVFEEELGNMAENPVFCKILFRKVYPGVKSIRLNVIETFGHENYFKLQRLLPIMAKHQVKDK